MIAPQSYYLYFPDKKSEQILKVTGPVIKYVTTTNKCDKDANTLFGGCDSIIEHEIEVVSRKMVKVNQTVLRGGFGEGTKDGDQYSCVLEKKEGASMRDPALDASLLNAALNNELEEARQLIARGANVEAVDTTGQTPLHYAVRGDKAVAELLIAKGAKVDAKDNTGATPLHNAVLSSGTLEVIDLLIAKGADINAKNSYGITPLHFAAQVADKEQAERLIDEGADVNAKDNAGATPLHNAAWNGITITAELLIAEGADINAKANNGFTPLSNAVYGNDDGDVVELLITKGADINARDNKGQTPLALALSKNRKEKADLLRRHGAK